MTKAEQSIRPGLRRRFSRYLGIDYSGAKTPSSSLTGLRVFAAENTQPREVGPPPRTPKYWTRRGLAQWLVGELQSGPPTLVGIDHAFSFPFSYFEFHSLPPEWPRFLDDFNRHWPTDETHTYVDFVRDGVLGNGALRAGNARWRRLAEVRSKAKSVFHFDVQGSVAKSTHAGLPWLRFIRERLGEGVHFWPFDGWRPPQGKSVIAEVYPALFNRTVATEGRNPHQHDAYCVAQWLQRADLDGTIASFLEPSFLPHEREIAQIEGWILGLL